MDPLLDDAPCGYLSFTDDSTVVVINQTLCNWLGYEKGQVEGKSVELLFTVATRIFYNTHFFPLLKLEGQADEIYMTLRPRATEGLPVLTNARRRSETGKYITQCVFMPLHQRRKYEDEILLAKREAELALKETRHFRELSESLEQRTLELDRLYQKQKVFHENFVQFSKIISHDLQEPLRKIELFASEIFRNEQMGQKGKKAVEKIMASGLRLRELTKGLQQYIAIEEKTSPVQIDLARTIAAGIQQAIEYRGFSDFDVVTGAFPPLKAFKKQMELLFFHLADNSIQFRDEGRRLTINISATVTDENIYKATQDKYDYRPHVRIYYSDNGTGFDEQYRDYVFDLLNKMDAQSAGLGIGLSIIKKIVNNHGASVEVNSEKNIGTKFSFIFPAG